MNTFAYDAGRIAAYSGWPANFMPLWLTQAERVCWADGWRDVAAPAPLAAMEPEVVAVMGETR